MQGEGQPLVTSPVSHKKCKLIKNELRKEYKYSPHTHNLYQACSLTYDLPVGAEYGGVRPDRRSGGHQPHPLPRRLRLDLGNDDVSAREVPGLPTALAWREAMQTRTQESEVSV